jgi:hypothetical protein
MDTDVRPSRRLAAITILGFWLVYFIANTTLAALKDTPDQLAMGWRRALVCLISIGLTFILYGVLRRHDRLRPRRLLTLAFAASLPLALAYSTFNWAVFQVWFPMDHGVERTITVVTTERRLPAPPAPPPGSDELSVDLSARSLPPPPPGARIVVRSMDRDRPGRHIPALAMQWYFFICCWAVLWVALTYAAQMRAMEARAARFAGLARDAELRALRYQVNPHFLFNTLNSLSSLVMANRSEDAERTIVNLSRFFRASLEGDPAGDTALRDEVGLQRLYLDIEKVRFPERLQVRIEVTEEAAACAVPGFVLQPLVENAVRHAVAPSREPVTVGIEARVEADMLRVTVWDDGRAGAAPPGCGVGLPNVRDRLAARFGDAAHCASGPRGGGGFAVTLTMPAERA